MQYCSQHVCMSVCLSVCISEKAHVQTSLNFLYVLPVATAQSSDDIAVHYVLLALCMMLHYWPHTDTVGLESVM